MALLYSLLNAEPAPLPKPKYGMAVNGFPLVEVVEVAPRISKTLA